MRRSPTPLLLILYSVTTASHAQVEYQHPVQKQVAESIQQQSQLLYGSQDFVIAQRNAAIQSKAVTAAAAKVPTNYANNLLTPGAVDRVAEEAGSMNKAVVQQVGTREILMAKLSLPGLDQLSSDIKYGKYVTVSKKGNETILLIKTIINSNNREKSDNIRKLQSMANDGVPEANNFMGFMFEYGLYGANRNIDKAISYYNYSARSNYQAALYNLANIMYLGKYGKFNVAESFEIIKRANNIGQESSFRVCGLGAFMNYRQGYKQEALRYGSNCSSPLSNIPNSYYSENIDINTRIKMLRDSIGVGADDGYAILEKITKTIKTDHNYLHCKYKVVNYLHFKKDPKHIREIAEKCLIESGNYQGKNKASEMNIVGITGFASVETNALIQMRNVNRYHYSWSVPYLPFNQNDIDMFEKVMPKEKK